MTKYELLTLLVSVLAVVVSTISLIRTRKIASQQLQLEKITAELSKKQLEQILENEKQAEQAFIDVELYSVGSNNELSLTNNSHAVAQDIQLKFISDYDPTIQSDFESKIPISSLRPGKEVTLIAISEMGTPSSFEVEVTWTNPDGNVVSDKQTIYDR